MTSKLSTPSITIAIAAGPRRGRLALVLGFALALVALIGFESGGLPKAGGATPAVAGGQWGGPKTVG